MKKVRLSEKNIHYKNFEKNIRFLRDCFSIIAFFLNFFTVVKKNGHCFFFFK